MATLTCKCGHSGLTSRGLYYHLLEKHGVGHEEAFKQTGHAIDDNDIQAMREQLRAREAFDRDKHQFEMRECKICEMPYERRDLKQSKCEACRRGPFGGTEDDPC